MKLNKTIIAPFLFSLGLFSCSSSVEIPSLDAFRDGIHHWNLEHKDRNYKRLLPEQYVAIADNFLAYQNEDGGWPKMLIGWLFYLPILLRMP